MKKTLKKIFTALTASVLCAVPMSNGFSASAAGTGPLKTYVVYNVAQDSSIAYFDFALNYEADVTAEQSVATSLCDGGYFRSTNNASSHKIQDTYIGDAIGTTGKLVSTKFIVPKSTESIYDVVHYSAPVIRNANSITLSPTSITLEAVLLGDVNLDGDVTIDDAALLNSYVNNCEKYPLTAEQLDAGDVYSRGDGINNMDVLAIQQYVANIISHF